MKTRVKKSAVSFRRNTEAKYNVLTELVVEYKEKNAVNNFIQISKLTNLLVYNTLKQYNMLDEDPSTVEDIRENCMTLILLKSIDSYDKTRGASFCTHYVWQLRSYVQWQRNVYYRRARIRKAVSLDCPVSDDNKSTLSETITSSSPTLMHRAKREFHKWLGEGSRYINYRAFAHSYNQNPEAFDGLNYLTPERAMA